MMSLPEGLETRSKETRDLSSLPSVVLEHIFGYLTEENLYLFGEVCNDWAKLIEDRPPKITWSPWFAKHLIGDVMLTLRHAPGSRFSKAEDIDDMLKVIENLSSEERTSNPFLNHTMIVNKETQQEYHSLHEQLAAFMTEFGSHVHRLMYYVDRQTPESLENQKFIFQSLSNLRSLALYNPGFETDIKELKDPCNVFPAQPNLSELEILGPFELNTLESLTRAYGPQIWSLTINSTSLAMFWKEGRVLGELRDWDRFVRAVRNCSNLKRFKISTLDLKHTMAGDTQYFKGLPIQHLSINNFSCEESFIKDVSVSKIMSIFGDSIETLSFFGEMRNSVWRISNQSGPPCTSIRVLNILLSAVGTESFPVLLRDFPNLKKLTLFDRKDAFRNKWLEKEELEKICEPFWVHVSPSVESISIRSRIFSKRCKKYFPTFFTCDRAQN